MLTSIFLRLQSPSFYITIFRYALAVIGGYLTANGRLDPGQWETIAGSLISIAAALFGGADAGKEKVSIAGQQVAKEQLPVPLQQQLEAVVPVRKSRTIFDIFLGK